MLSITPDLCQPDASTPPTPSCDNQICLQTLPDVPWVGNSPPFENHWWILTCANAFYLCPLVLKRGVAGSKCILFLSHSPTTDGVLDKPFLVFSLSSKFYIFFSQSTNLLFYIVLENGPLGGMLYQLAIGV